MSSMAWLTRPAPSIEIGVAHHAPEARQAGAVTGVEQPVIARLQRGQVLVEGSYGEQVGEAALDGRLGVVPPLAALARVGGVSDPGLADHEGLAVFEVAGDAVRVVEDVPELAPAVV